MRSIRLLSSSLAFVIAFAGAAFGQNNRSFVSGLGSDSNPCSRPAPCRNFAQALSQTNAGGEVVALDSAGYGPLTINKAVSIIAPPGVYAGITVFSGVGIDITAGNSDVVVLRGLSLNGQGGTAGVVYNSGSALHIENTVISGFSQAGIAFQAPGSLFVNESIIKNAGTNGIFADCPSSTTVSLTIDNVRLEGNRQGLGINDAGLVTGTIRNSVASGNMFGIAVFPLNGTAELNVENCLIANNQTGVTASSSDTGLGTVRVSNSTVTDNSFGLSQTSGGVILSRGNNTVEGNTTNLAGTIGSYSAK